MILCMKETYLAVIIDSKTGFFIWIDNGQRLILGSIVPHRTHVMTEKFTPFRLKNWESSPTHKASKWMVYEVDKQSDSTRTVLPQLICDKNCLTRPSATVYALVGKRCVDIASSAFDILFILSWLVPIVALFICLDSSGPFYFTQLRTGRNGKPFYCLKFRTMVHSSDKAGFQQALKNDDRVTRTGQFLRRTNLDEMLQFINVLVGDMTLVGPRPHAVAHDAMHWSSEAYRARYLVKPGITGLAQIRGARGATTHGQSMDNRVRYDHFYISKRKFTLDMKISIDTVLLMLRGDKNAW